MKVSIIIPNYNGRALLEKNLPQLLEAFRSPKNHILEVIVVDDCSTDSSVQYIKAAFPEIKVVRHTSNRGFASTVNTGVRSAKGELVCLLNTDVAPSKDFLHSAAAIFKDKNVFGVSLHERGHGWAKAVFNGYFSHSPGAESSSVHDSLWVSGGSGIFSRDLWKKVGGLDEKLFSPFYWEDIDISYRAQKRGFRVLWDPEAKVVHEHEATISKLSLRYVQRIRERNELLFIWKNITSAALTRKHMRALFSRVFSHPGYVRIVIMAAMKLPAVVSARKLEKKEARVSDEAIFAKFN